MFLQKWHWNLRKSNDDFSKKCHAIFEKLLLLHWTFLNYLVCVSSFKSINSSSLPRKKYGALSIRLLGIKDSLATADLICQE